MRISGLGVTICGLALLAASAPAQKSHAGPRPAQASNEERTTRAFEQARTNPNDLYNFLYRMPKGADLHNHAAGAVYAETWIREAIEDKMCVDTATLVLSALPSEVKAGDGACDTGKVPAAKALADQHLYDAMVNAFSMRSFVPFAGTSGHDHFFDTFDKFQDVDGERHLGEWLDEITTRAASQNEQYIELMDTPSFSHAAALSMQLGWNDDLAKLRDDLLSHGLRDEVAIDRARWDRAEKDRMQRERCGQKDATPACRVEVRYLYQVLRGLPKQIVFAQTLLGFETASIDPRVVGINYVMPEDGYTSMTDYALHMRIVGFLHGLYPKVHISLHAGELAPGMVPYEGLCCHIRTAIEQARAERIGHGVDVMYEEHPYELLQEMAAKHVMVEINLTSNDVILGVTGKNHPLQEYRKFGVPVALSTDDEGVSRINLTHEYVRAAETYELKYPDLKRMVRTSLEHTFLPGASLWAKPDGFGAAVSPCEQETLGAANPKGECGAFLKKSEKARQQWELERRFREFEASAADVIPAAKAN